MEEKHVFDNMDIIRRVYDILKKENALTNYTLRIKMSFFKNLSEEDYKRIDYNLKAIRQDYAKMLVIMNSIDRTYAAYKKDEYIPTYYSNLGDQATAELGCYIEYLFAKYRVILDYIQQIMEICIPPKFNADQANKYNRLKKSYKKYKFLLEYIANNIKAVNLQTITKTMLDSADEAESCGNLIKSVWYNAIYNKNDASTDKYTMKDEHFFVSDFNDALHKLFSDLTFSSRVDKISEQQDTVNALMKKLKNPPEKYKEAYEKMSKLYDSYIKLTNMVTDPNGSLQTYSDTFNETDTEVLNNYKALGVYLEE